MKLQDAIAELTGILKSRVSYADVAAALDVTRQYANQIKARELGCEQIKKLEDYFKIKFTNVNQDYGYGLVSLNNDCIDIPVRGYVTASMGYGVTVYNEAKTASYSIGKKLASDLCLNEHHTEMIFAQGDSMMPTIEGGDSLLVDHSRREIYDGKIYCVRIDNQLYAKRLQKIPPDTVRIVSDNDKYR